MFLSLLKSESRKKEDPEIEEITTEQGFTDNIYWQEQPRFRLDELLAEVTHF